MARQIDSPDSNPGTGEPGDPGYIPPTAAGTKIAFIVSGLNMTIASDQIAAAGGPWEAFTIRVTPMNNTGSGTYAEVDVEITPEGVIYDGQVPL